MTASSLDLFSRQVPLIGLPPQAQQTTTATVNGVTNVNGVLRQRVSRNLFGGPKTGEINQMLKQETQRQKAYVLKRYLVNLENLDANERIPSEMPSLIAKELQEYEQRITKEKCNLNRDLVTSTTSPAENSSSAKLKQITQIKRTASNNNTEDAVLCGSERGKPYARQTLMTDCFNKRKMTPTLTPATTTAAVTTTTAVTATAAITVNAYNAGTTTASSNDLQVLDLPTPMRATLSLCTSSAESALISAAATTATEVDNTTTCDVAAITTTTVDTNLATTPHL